MGTYREAICTDGFDEAGVYFGTNTAGLRQRRQRRDLAPHHLHLPPVSSITATLLD